MKINSNKIAVLCTALTLGASLPLVANSDITPVVTQDAPKAIGPYSQAIVAGNYLFVSGQIPIDPTTGKMTAVTIEEQTFQVLNNLEAILAAQGLTLENVVKTEVYLKDLNDFAVMNKIYAERFSHEVKPARATIQVSKLPMDALIEISCVAFQPNSNNN